MFDWVLNTPMQTDALAIANMWNENNQLNVVKCGIE